MSPLCKKYCKASGKVTECEDCEKHFHASCARFGEDELLNLESGNLGKTQTTSLTVVYAVVLF